MRYAIVRKLPPTEFSGTRWCVQIGHFRRVLPYDHSCSGEAAVIAAARRAIPGADLGEALYAGYDSVVDAYFVVFEHRRKPRKPTT